MDRKRYQTILTDSRKLRPRFLSAMLLMVVQTALTVMALCLATQNSILLGAAGQILIFVVSWRWFSIMHTAAHGAVFPGRRANDVIGLGASVFSLLPYHHWKAAHLGHHQWTGWHGRDPALSFPSEAEAPPSLKRVMDVSWRYHLPFFSLYFIFGKFWGKKQLASGSPLTELKSTGKPRAAQAIVSYAVLIGAHLALASFFGLVYLKVMALPVLAYLISSDIVLLNQHSEFDQRLVEGGQVPRPLHPVEHLQHTRSVLLPELISRHVFLRFDWHELHHLYPNVPHDRLESLRAVVGALPNEISLGSWMRQARQTPGHRLALSQGKKG